MNNSRVGNVKYFLEEEKKKRGCKFCGTKEKLYFKNGERWKYKCRIQNAIHDYTSIDNAICIVDNIDIVCKKCVPANNRTKDRKKDPNYTKTRRKNINDWFKSEKIKRSCEICGRSATECVSAFSFHHNKNDKKKDLSVMARNGSSKKTISEEMKKCVFVCENCHRKLHYDISVEQNVYKNPRRRWFNDIKEKATCVDCGEKNHFSAIDFHHMENKKECIGNMVSSMESEHIILMELEKCVPLCAVCHRKHHTL